MVIDSLALAVASLLFTLLGLVISVGPHVASKRFEAGRASSWRQHGPRVIWLTNEVRGPLALSIRRRHDHST